jgi:hypothetical protein
MWGVGVRERGIGCRSSEAAVCGHATSAFARTFVLPTTYVVLPVSSSLGDYC